MFQSFKQLVFLISTFTWNYFNILLFHYQHFIISLSTFFLKLIIINSTQATFYKFKIKLFQQLRSFKTTFIYNYFQHYNNIVPIKFKITDILSPMNQLLKITYFAIVHFPVLNNQCPGKLFATFLNKVS